METYLKFFKMMTDHIKPPITLNCDFEKAIHLAAHKAFENCLIYGCFFHLSQNWYKRLGKLSLNKYFFSDTQVRLAFKMCQSLAYLPVSEVTLGFEDILEKFSSYEILKPFFVYLEKNYIGKKNKHNKRINSRFPIVTWNLHVRVLEDKPTTNNPVESWYSSLTSDTRSHPTINLVIHEIRLEESKTHSHIIKLDCGGTFTVKSKKKHRIKCENIKNMVKNYHTYSSRIVFLEYMSINMGNDKL